MTLRPMALSALLIILPAAAWAQPDPIPTQLRRALWRGDRVTVTVTRGRRISGEIAQVTDTTLVLERPEWHWNGHLAQENSIDLASVQTIVRRDRIDDGAWRGAGIGLLATIAVTVIFCQSHHGADCELIAVPLFLPSVAGGFAIGAIADA